MYFRAFVDSTSLIGDGFMVGLRRESLGAHAANGIVTPDHNEPPKPRGKEVERDVDPRACWKAADAHVRMALSLEGRRGRWRSRA